MVRPAELSMHNPIASGHDFCIDSCSISVDGKYIYSRSVDNSLKITIHSFTPSDTATAPLQLIRNSPHIVPVTNGAFVWTDDSSKSPKLWNSDKTEVLVSFPELTGTLNCLSVADNLLACVMESQVCFLDSLTKKVVTRIPLPKSLFIRFRLLWTHIAMEVIACSSLYHVLAGPFLLQNEITHDLRVHIQPGTPRYGSFPASALTACFSPSGRLLALSGRCLEKLLIFEIDPPKICCQFKRQLVSDTHFGDLKLEFVNEKHLLYAEKSPSLLRLVDVEACTTLTCIDFGQNTFNSFYKVSFCACRETGRIVCFSRGAKRIKIIKLWLPNQR